MLIEIDRYSGFCFGVIHAIGKAEEHLSKHASLDCLGDIVHNHLEVQRLEKIGLSTIDYDLIDKTKGKTILFRAHGEPPITYQKLHENNHTLIDATCPVVLKLQQRIRSCYLKNPDAQIVIYGQRGHAEVNGLLGQTDNTAIIIEEINQLNVIDFNRTIFLFSQTTKSIDGFQQLVTTIQSKIESPSLFQFKDTICRQVANRVPKIIEFSKRFDIIIFVSGKKSSNGRFLFQKCLENNPNTFFISSPSEIDLSLLSVSHTLGICGATSTPQWQMEEVKQYIQTYIH